MLPRKVGKAGKYHEDVVSLCSSTFWVRHFLKKSVSTRLWAAIYKKFLWEYGWDVLGPRLSISWREKDRERERERSAMLRTLLASCSLSQSHGGRPEPCGADLKQIVRINSQNLTSKYEVPKQLHNTGPMATGWQQRNWNSIPKVELYWKKFRIRQEMHNALNMPSVILNLNAKKFLCNAGFKIQCHSYWCRDICADGTT